MPINRTISGARVGDPLEIQLEITGTDCFPGDKWRLTVTGITLAPAAAQEIPVGATSHTLTWKSATPLPTGIANPITVELYKEHGSGASLTPVQTFQVPIAPAPSAPAPATPPAAPAPASPPAAPTPPVGSPLLPQPLQVQVVNGGGAARWFYSAGMVGWLGGLVILLVVLAFLWVVLYVIAPTAMHGLSATPALPAGQSTVVTEVKQTTISTDPAVLQEAAKASANISH